MSILIEGMKLPQHAAVNGEKNTAYKCVILAHPDNSVELVIDIKFASAYDNGHNILRYPLVEVPTPHGRLIDEEAIYNNVKSRCNNCHIRACAICGVTCILNDIRTAPTIIEAEVSEE